MIITLQLKANRFTDDEFAEPMVASEVIDLLKNASDTDFWIDEVKLVDVEEEEAEDADAGAESSD